jgi:hypothetical protein
MRLRLQLFLYLFMFHFRHCQAPCGCKSPWFCSYNFALSQVAADLVTDEYIIIESPF